MTKATIQQIDEATSEFASGLLHHWYGKLDEISQAHEEPAGPHDELLYLSAEGAA